MPRKARLRAPRREDLPEILRIERDAFLGDAFSARQFRYLFEQAKGESFIADCDGSVGAYATVLLPALPRPARIYSLAVAPPFRGRGLALALCEAMIRSAKEHGCDRVRLEVRGDNAGALRLYEGLGFVRFAELPTDYYADGSGGWRMELAIDEGGA
ncbi:MAG: GNAT family N-acetyltransferase [Halieaceae bacterium]|jgi:ribosomal protein S18 acetylase RimI-like enzyme|nr:GNAT family N-acetyltransferase [Halieaceae bacterium]